jgi:hypothetical protein
MPFSLAVGPAVAHAALQENHMPTSKKPSRPYKGNKFLIQSREYQDLNKKIHQLVTQLQQVQAVMMVMIQGPQDPATPITETAEIPREAWDAIETETDRLVAANDAEYVNLSAAEAVQEALAPQEAV